MPTRPHFARPAVRRSRPDSDARRPGPDFAAVERLEDRVVLTTTMFLDFGLGLGIDGALTTTVTEFRNVFGPGLPDADAPEDDPGRGSDGTGTDLEGRFGLGADDAFALRPLQYDFNGDGELNLTDIDDLANAAAAYVRRAMEPFDIDVVVSAASGLDDARALVAANGADPAGEFDSYNFITELVDLNGNSLTAGTSAFGQAAGDDLFDQFGNRQDEASLTYADSIFRWLDGRDGLTAGTDDFDVSLAAALGYVGAHEGMHTYTVAHSTGELAGGDVIRQFLPDPHQVFQVVRFDLPKADIPGAPENSYRFLADDPDIGLRDADRDGVPDLAYVSGTGLHDEITLTDAGGFGGDLVSVTVSAYRDAARTDLVRSESYFINLATDTEAGILVDAGLGSDRVVIDGAIATLVRVRGGVGVDGAGLTAGGDADELLVDYGDRTGGFSTDADGRGVYAVDAGAEVVAAEFESESVLAVRPTAFLTADEDDVTEGDAVTLAARAEDLDAAAGEVVNYHYEVFREGEAAPFLVESGDGLTAFTFTPGDEGVYEVVLTVTDANGQSDTDSVVVTAANADPTIALTGVSGPVTEGDRVTLAGTVADAGADDPLTVTVTWGDGTTETVTLAAGQTAFSFDHVYEDDGFFAPTVRATDGDGGEDLAGTVVTVANADPVVTAGTGGAVTEGSAATLSGRVTDAGVRDVRAVTIDWGDGTTDSAAVRADGTFAARHVYADGGGQFTAYDVTVTATDDDGGVGVAETGVDVLNARPTLSRVRTTRGAVRSAGGGGAVTLTGAATDAGLADALTLDVDWGDGTETTGVPVGGAVGGAFALDHAYRRPGVYDVTVRLTDADGAFVSEQLTATVSAASLRTESGGDSLFVFGTNRADEITLTRVGGAVSVTMNGAYLGRFAADRRIVVEAGGGDDVVVVSNTLNLDAALSGGRGDDRLVGGRGDDSLDGGVGEDVLIALVGDNRLDGGAGDDVLRGGDGDDVLTGGGGDDRLAGRRGDDVLRGGRGADRLNGAAGDDALDGGRGDDRLNAGRGTDVLVGGRGADRLRGGANRDLLIAGPYAPAADDAGADDAGFVLADLSGLWSAPGGAADAAARVRRALAGAGAAGSDGDRDRLLGGGGRDLLLGDAREDRGDAFLDGADFLLA